MFQLFTQLARQLTARRAARAHAGGARRLLETAEARAGQDPQHARELRDAAFAYLRVVR